MIVVGGLVTRLRAHPRVRGVRQAGTVAILEVEAGGDENAGYLADVGPRLRRCYEQRRMLLRPLGPVVYVLPPYCIQPGELDGVWDVVESSLDHIAG